MKSLNEQLFDRIMRLPHAMRGQMLAGERPVPQGPMGPHCGLQPGPRPMPRRGGEEGWAETMPFREHDRGALRTLPYPERGPGGMGPEGGFPHGPRLALNRERVLEVLLENEEGLRQKEIGERMGVNPSSMSEFIQRLEADGYVERSVDPEDRRATRIRLTDLGRARAWELADEKENRYARLFGNLTDEEKAELIRLIDKMLPEKRLPQRTQLV